MNRAFENFANKKNYISENHFTDLLKLKKMKNYLYILAALTMVSCSSESTGDYLEELTTKRDSIKEVYQGLGTELAEVELLITKLDTGKRMVNVTVQEANNQKFEHYFKVYGGISADKNTTIYPAMSGDVVTVKVEEGQTVKKGQILFKIDSEILESNIVEVKTQRSLAQDVYTKQKSLWDKQIGSEMDYLRAKNTLESLDSKLATMQKQLQKTNVEAPYNGTIDAIFIKTGQLVSPQVPTMRIVNLDKVYLKADIPENYIKVISKGSPVKLNFPSIGMAYDTKINETGKFINPANRTFSVRIDIENSENLLYPNLLGMVEIQDYGKENAMVIPARLIQEDAQGNSFLFLAIHNDGLTTSVIRKIKVGMTYEGNTEVTHGLVTGDLVIDKGSRSVSNGQLIGIAK
jgi:RND family efflux transporter MFP subunit